MANFIETTEISPSVYVTPVSRYLNSKVIYYTEAKRLTFATYKREEPKISQDDQFTVITKGTEYRPDLISQRAYGFPDLWWKIMEANGISDILEFKAGKVVRLPNFIF